MITYEDCKDIQISLSKPYGNSIICLDIKPDELAWILNECVKSGVVSSTKRGIKMTKTELRWCTIDGTEWMASAGEVRFLVCLVDTEYASVYQSYVIYPDKPIFGFGTYDTINEAKEACLEYLK